MCLRDTKRAIIRHDFRWWKEVPCLIYAILVAMSHEAEGLGSPRTTSIVGIKNGLSPGAESVKRLART